MTTTLARASTLVPKNLARSNTRAWTLSREEAFNTASTRTCRNPNQTSRVGRGRECMKVTENGQEVKGDISAEVDDINLRRALSLAPNIEYYWYKV